METHIAQDFICPQMIRGAAVYVALWRGHKLCIALGCMKFISLTFKSPFLTAHTTCSSTKFKPLILKGERIVPFCENHRVNPLKPELNPICYLLALLGTHHFLHVSRIRVKLLTFRRLMLYIYGAPILDVSRSRTTTQHSR